MSAAITYLVLSLAVAAFAGLGLWLRQQRTRSPFKDVEHFQQALRALQPTRDRER